MGPPLGVAVLRVYDCLARPHDGLDLLVGVVDGDASAPVRVLPWLDDPNVVAAQCLQLLVPVGEHCPGPVLQGSHVESERQPLEHIHTLLAVVVTHIVEQGFLVPQVLILRKVVMAMQLGTLRALGGGLVERFLFELRPYEIRRVLLPVLLVVLDAPPPSLLE